MSVNLTSWIALKPYLVVHDLSPTRVHGLYHTCLKHEIHYFKTYSTVLLKVDERILNKTVDSLRPLACKPLPDFSSISLEIFRSIIKMMLNENYEHHFVLHSHTVVRQHMYRVFYDWKMDFFHHIHTVSISGSPYLKETIFRFDLVLHICKRRLNLPVKREFDEK